MVGDVAHRYAGLGGDVKEIDVCAAVIHLLHERERHEDGAFVIAVDVHSAVAVVDAHNAVVDRVDASAGVASLREEILIDLLADYTHLASLSNVHFVDVASVAQVGRNHLSHLRRDALHRT